MVASDFKHTLEILDQFGRAFVNEYKSELEAERIADGELYRTVSYSVSSGTSKWVISIKLADYWKYVENGRRPGKMPPRDAIERWINIKHIIPHPMTLKTGKTVIPSIPQLSFLIARSIGQRGIRPRPLFKNSFEIVKMQFLTQIKEAVIQDIKEGLEF